MISPALLDASRDPRLKGAEFRILGHLYGELIPGEYRTVKLWVLARDMRIPNTTTCLTTNDSRCSGAGRLKDGWTTTTGTISSGTGG